MPDDRRTTDLDGLPLSGQEYQRRKDAALDQGGVFFDLDQRTGTLKMSLSPEAEDRLAREAAAAGVDLDTYLQQLWQKHVDAFMAQQPR